MPVDFQPKIFMYPRATNAISAFASQLHLLMPWILENAYIMYSPIDSFFHQCSSDLVGALGLVHVMHFPSDTVHTGYIIMWIKSLVCIKCCC